MATAELYFATNRRHQGRGRWHRWSCPDAESRDREPVRHGWPNVWRLV